MAKAADGGSLVQEIKDLEQAGTLTDRSGTTGVGVNTVTTAVANPARSYLLIQNNGAGVKWVNFGVPAVATQPSIQLAPGASLIFQFPGFVPSDGVNIFCAAAEAYTVKEF